MRTKGVIFDCDGTLLDTMDMWHEIEADLARASGVEPSEELAAELAPLTLPEVAAYFHERHGLGASNDDVLGMLTESAIKGYGTIAAARPGTLAVVEALAAAGVCMSVASSSSQAMLQAGLAHAGFLPYLDAVFSVDDVGESKRSPKVYHAAREVMGTTVAETWGAEDAIYAVRTLNKAGYRTVGIYDTDPSGTWEQLQAEATLAITTWEGFDIARLG
ncbi:MAG TPA: HAD family phosphatase [Candidatus Aveggerthella excrementigallinarum]|nr:HAD family phosphatase [Candidatus Aveggerthella excrementigallinarum]